MKRRGRRQHRLSSAPMAEDERERIVTRANDGRRVARAKGVKFGREPKLTAHQQKAASGFKRGKNK